MQLSWLVCFILSAVVGFLNPHIGLFAAITIIQALITAAFLFNIRKRLEAESAARQMGSQSAADAYRKSAEAQKKILFLAAIILALALTAAYALLWFMSAIVDEGTVTLAPIDALGIRGKTGLSAALLLIQIALELIGTVLVCMAIKRVRAGEQHYQSETAQGTLQYRVRALTIVILLAACCVGTFFTNMGWLSVLLHLFYVLEILMVALYARRFSVLSERQDGLGVPGRVGVRKMLPGGSINTAFVFIAWAIATLIVVVEIVLMQSQVSFALSHSFGWTGVLISGLLEVLTALLAGRDIRAMNLTDKGDS